MILDVQIVDDVEQDVLVLVRDGDPGQLPALEDSSELILLVLVAQLLMFFPDLNTLITVVFDHEKAQIEQ